MGELLSLFHGMAASIGIAGLALIWIIKATAGWMILRWWRLRRSVKG